MVKLRGIISSSMQPTLIIWGEHDRVFPLELGHRLKRLIFSNNLIALVLLIVQF